MGGRRDEGPLRRDEEPRERPEPEGGEPTRTEPVRAQATRTQATRTQAVRTQAVRTHRLGMLSTVDAGHGDTEVLLSALLHATADLGGLGGMAHLRARDIARDLRMVASSGLSRPFTRPWMNISEDGSVAPARAVRDESFIYLPDIGVPEQLYGRTPGDVPPSGVPAGAGMVAVPLPGPDGPLGALCVVTCEPGGPDAAQRAFFEEVARWAGGRLRLSPLGPEGVSPNLLHGQDPGPGPRQVLQAVAVGTWEWDLRTGDMVFDERMIDALNLDRNVFDWRIETWADLIHPDDLPWVVAEADRVIRTRGVMDIEYRVRRADGSYNWVRNQDVVALDDDGEPARLVVTMWDTTETHAALESVGRALRHMTDGFVALGGDWRIGFVNLTAEQLLGPSTDVVGRVLWDVPAMRGVPDLEERCRHASADCAPSGFDVRWPGTDRWYHLRLVPVPDGLTVYVTDVTEKRRRKAAERAAAERAALIAGLTRALAEAVTAQDVVCAVADSVLPPFDASGLVVFALENDRLSLVGSVGYPEAFQERLHGMLVAADTPAGEVLRTGAPEFLESPDDFTGRYPGGADYAAAGGKKAWAFLPLIASGREIGVCVVSYDRSRHLEEDERALLTTLSGLIAQALERAGLYDAATNRARELQRALLPRVLPSLPGVTAAARYLPSARGADVGGDWYDIIPLSADRVAMVIGDVMGHGMSEAATMGRLRTAVRTLADLELPPDEVLARLNDIVGDLGDDSFVTCLYGIYDPTTQILSYANAGHLPPAVAHPDGTVSYPVLVPDPPLGVAAPPFDTTDLRLPDGSLLVLYTDGLVEDPGRDIDEGMDYLASALAKALREGPAGSDGRGGAAGRDLHPDALCDTLTMALLPADHPAGDDTALLIARTHALAPDSIASWPLPEDPRAAGQARDHIREQFRAWHLDEELAMTTELLASELISNVIRHARGPIRLRLLRSRSLICEVSDGSLTTPHIRHASATDEGGRGLQLVAALAQRWGTRYTPGGKCIWTEQLIAE